MTQIHISTAFPSLYFSLSKKPTPPGKCAYKLMLRTVACFEGLTHPHDGAHQLTEAT